MAAQQTAMTAAWSRVPSATVADFITCAIGTQALETLALLHLKTKEARNNVAVVQLCEALSIPHTA